MTPSSKLLLCIQSQLSKVQAHRFRLQEPISSRVSLVFVPWLTAELSCHDALTHAALPMMGVTTPDTYHRTSSRRNTDPLAVLPNNVNKTSLHPTGVTYVPHDTSICARFTNTCFSPHQEHTELEQELHDKAHIDYDRVAIVRSNKHSLKTIATNILLLRSPTLQSPPSTRMLLFTRLVPPSHPAVP